jgi:uncharacterized membrane-anchored protein YitT (DUF2179 family)
MLSVLRLMMIIERMTVVVMITYVKKLDDDCFVQVTIVLV